MRGKFTTGFLVFLLLILAVGLVFSISGVFAQTDAEHDDNKYGLIRVSFVIRGEIYQVHYVHEGSRIVAPPVSDELFRGWAIWGTAEMFNFATHYMYIENDTMFVALLPFENLFEYEIPAISTPQQIELNQPTYIVQRNSDGVLLSLFIVGEGTITFNPNSATIQVLHNGNHVSDLWWSPTVTTYLRGYSIG